MSYFFSWFQVHHGFYSAYHNTTLRPGIINAVKSVKELYGDLQIMVTGHSMGGAMASFCGLDLTVILYLRCMISCKTYRIWAFEGFSTLLLLVSGQIIPLLPPFWLYYEWQPYLYSSLVSVMVDSVLDFFFV